MTTQTVSSLPSRNAPKVAKAITIENRLTKEYRAKSIATTNIMPAKAAAIPLMADFTQVLSLTRMHGKGGKKRNYQ